MNRVSKSCGPRKLVVCRSLEARAALILENREVALRMGAKLMRASGGRLADDELRSCVDLALCEAARLYGTSDAAFLTYAHFFIRGELCKTLRRTRSANMPLDIRDGAHESDADFAAHREGSAEDSLDNTRLADRAKACLTKLPPRTQEVVLRSAVLEEKVVRIAQRLSLSRGHVFELRRQGLDQIRAQLFTELPVASAAA